MWPDDNEQENPNLFLFVNVAGVPEPSRPDMLRASFRTLARLRRMLQGEVAHVTINVHFFEDLGPDILAGTANVYGPSTFGFVANELANNSDANFDAREDSLYSSLSPSGFVNASFNDGFSTQTQEIRLPAAVISKWFGGIANIDIIFNLQQSWDWRSTDGSIAAGNYDYEAVLTHECLHALGFSCRENQDPTPSAERWIRLLDIFHLPYSGGASTLVTSPVFTGAYRRIADGDAMFVGGLNDPSRVFRMAPGWAGPFYHQHSHWFPDEFAGQLIGIMDVTLAAGTLVPFGDDVEPGYRRYLASSDVLAMDAIGWDINLANYHDQPPGPPNPTTPSNGQAIGATQPTLAWIGGLGPGESFSLSMTDDLGVQVLKADDLMSTSFAVPSGVCEAGRSYAWRVTNVGESAFTLGTLSTFSIGCDSVDFNLDSLFPDSLDIEDYLSVFAGGVCNGQSGPPACNADLDFNNDGLFPDSLDVESLLSVFAGGPCL